MCRQGYRNKQVYDPLWSVRNRRPPDVMPPAGRKVTFDGRYGCRKCFCVTFDKSNKTAVSSDSFLNIAMSGVNKDYMQYLALLLEGEVKEYDNKKDNKRHDWSWFPSS